MKIKIIKLLIISIIVFIIGIFFISLNKSSLYNTKGLEGQVLKDVKLEYFNTASSKLILSIIKQIGESSKDISINWHYLEDDEDMLDVGEHLSEILGGNIVNIILDEE